MSAIQRYAQSRAQLVDEDKVNLEQKQTKKPAPFL